jgi:hypothetical protein
VAFPGISSFFTGTAYGYRRGSGGGEVAGAGGEAVVVLRLKLSLLVVAGQGLCCSYWPRMLAEMGRLDCVFLGEPM